MAKLCTDIIRCKIKNWKEWLKSRAEWDKSIKKAKEEEKMLLLLVMMMDDDDDIYFWYNEKGLYQMNKTGSPRK